MLSVLTKYATRVALASAMAVAPRATALEVENGSTVQRPPADRTREIQLFAEDSLEGWTLADGLPIRSGWRFSEGVLHLDPRQGRAGHIVTERKFGDFDLTFEWKIAAGGNSGFKYRVRRYAHKMLGCEYQVLDDASKSDLARRHSTGALYDLYAPNDQKTLFPAGQYNTSRVVVARDRAEHWLNGRRVLAVDIGDDEWRRRVAQSKFAELTGFGQNRRGRLMITDHRSEVWYRNFRMRLFPTGGQPHEDDRSHAAASQ